jgi:vitamin B12 transporter
MHATFARRRFAIRLVMPVLVTVPSLGLGAQQADTARTGRAAGDTAHLERIVVTATRTDVALPAASLGTTVVSGEELRARGITHLAEALRTVPSMMIVRSGSFGGVTSLFLRGGESNYVKVLVDGVPLNAAGGAIDLATIAIDEVDRIEIVRGSASVLYGSDAVSGVVQIFTRRPDGAPRGAVQARGGSYGSREASASVSGDIVGSGLAGAFAAAIHDADGIYAFNNGYRNDTYDASLRARPGSRTDLRLSGRFSDTEAHLPTNGSGAVVDSNQVRTEERRLVAFDAAHILSARVEAHLELAVATIDAVSDDQPDSEGDSLGFYSRTSSEALRQRADARLDVHLHERALLTLGTEWSRQRERSLGQSRFGTSPLPDARFDASRVNRAAYAQLLSGGSERVSATIGARVDDNERFGTFVTGRAAAAVRVASTTLRGAVGSAFREPAFDEHFTTAFSVGNPALDPERSVSWELGVSRAFLDARVVLTATAFDQRFRDMIQYAFQEDPSAPNYVNVARANASGLELEARLPALGRFDATASWSIVRTRVTEAGFGDFGAFEEGKSLLRRPRHTANLVGRYRLGARGTLSASLNHVGRRDDLDFSGFPAARVVLDPYTLVGLGLEVDVLAPTDAAAALRLTARVDNALDEDYVPVFGFRAPGRTVLVGVRAQIGR